MGDALANAVATQNAVAEMPAARLFLLLAEGRRSAFRRREKARAENHRRLSPAKTVRSR